MLCKCQVKRASEKKPFVFFAEHIAQHTTQLNVCPETCLLIPLYLSGMTNIS